MAKRLSKTLWYGTGLDTYGKPLLPPVATNESDLNGLHRGELFMHLDKDNVTLWALSSSNEVVQIAGKQGEIDIDLSDYLLKSTWDKVWELRKDNNGVEYIYSKLPVITRYGITMYADNGEVEVESIYAGLPIDRQTLIWKDGVLMVNPELDLGNGGGIDENELRDYLTRNDYAKKSDITTALNGYATTSSLNAVSTKLNDFLEGSDTDTVINKWKELEAFLLGLTESDNLATILTGKADKSYVDTNFVTIAGTEDVTGLHNFVNGLKIGGIELIKKQDDVVYLDANLVVRGGITMYAENEVDIPSILDSLPIASNSALGIASFDSTYFSVDSNGMVSLTSAPSSGASTLGELLNVDASIDATASVDRVLYQPAGSAIWTWKALSEIGSGSSGGSVSGDYLPLTGGTLTSSSAPLTINRDSSGKNSGITYQVQGTTVGILGFNPDGYLLVRPHASINDLYYYVLHHKNFSEYALPLTGGTLTGNLTISGTDASSSRIDFTRDGYSYITGKTLSFGSSTDTIDRMLILTSGSATFQCNILPSATKTYSIGSWDNFFKNASINAIYSGASSNNLWLVGGNSTDAYGVVIGRNGTAATSGAEICRFNANGMVWADGVTANIKSTSNAIQFWYKGLDTNGVYLGNATFAPFTASTDLISLGNSSRRWKGVFVGIGTVASNEYGLQFCDTSKNYVGRISHSANMGIYSSGDIYIRGGCTKGTSNLTASSTGLRVYASGDILVTGGITMYSDQRKKTILNHVELSLKQIADAPLIEHYYNSDQDKTIHVGSIAQYWAELNNWFCKLDNEGFYTMEIQNCALASAISIARHLEKYESKTDKKIRQLKKRISQLENEIELLKKGA